MTYLDLVIAWENAEVEIYGARPVYETYDE
jgi:hypothetical protein